MLKNYYSAGIKFFFSNGRSLIEIELKTEWWNQFSFDRWVSDLYAKSSKGSENGFERRGGYKWRWRSPQFNSLYLIPKLNPYTILKISFLIESFYFSWFTHWIDHCYQNMRTIICFLDMKICDWDKHSIVRTICTLLWGFCQAVK